jgi:PLD-like domain
MVVGRGRSRPNPLAESSAMNLRLLDRGWGEALTAVAATNAKPVLIMCPFIKIGALRQLLRHQDLQDARVITRFNLDDFANGVSDVQVLQYLLRRGVRVRGVKGLHSKVYVFGDRMAFVTSANLTHRGLYSNEEFGFASTDGAVISNCTNYFDGMWDRAGDDLTRERLNGWIARIDQEIASRTASTRPSLGDEGRDVGYAVNAAVSGPRAHNLNLKVDQWVLKFTGLASERVAVSTPISQLLARGGYRFVGFPSNKRPRAIQDGALIFISRMTSDPNDHIVFACAKAMAYKEGRDDAGPSDIRALPWTETWSRFIRLTDFRCVDGTLENGISTGSMIAELGSKSFASTQRRSVAESDIRKSMMQKAWLELTPESGEYLYRHLEQAFRECGEMSKNAIVAAAEV